MSYIWQILPHTSACVSGDRVYLLDIRQDRYLLVPSLIEDAVREWLTVSPAASAPSNLIVLLRRAGSIREGDPQPSNMMRQAVKVPETLTHRYVARPVSFGTLARTWQLTLATSIALRRRSLASLLSPFESGNADPESTCVQAAIAQTFEAARSKVPVQRRCLLDSLSLRQWLAREAQRPSLVFGVKEAPFSAHCWLQNSTTILNDQLDQVSRFTPILIV